MLLYVEERMEPRFGGPQRKRKVKIKHVNPKVVAVCRALDAGAQLCGDSSNPHVRFRGEVLNHPVPVFQLFYYGYVVDPIAADHHWYGKNLEMSVLTEKGIALARSVDP